MTKPLFDRIAALGHLIAHGPTKTHSLHQALGGVPKRQTLIERMHELAKDGFVSNVGTCQSARWAARLDHVPDVWYEPAAPAQKPQLPTPAPLFDPHCLQGQPTPRRFDVLRSSSQGASLPAMACARAGGQNFLLLPSLVAGERRAHQPGYVAVLASGRNQPAASA